MGEAGKLADRFLGELLVCGKSPETIRSYTHGLGVYLDHLLEVGVAFKDAEYQHVITFLQKLRLQKLADTTIQGRIAPVTGWYKWLRRMKVVKESPCEFVKFKVYKRKPEFYSEEELEKLIAATRRYPTNTERNVALIEFIYASGCRRSEVSALDVEDLVIGEQPYANIRKAKGKKDRLVLLGDRFVQAWKAYEPIRARLLSKWESPQEKAAFVTCTGKRIDPETIYYFFRRLCEFAGVKVLYPHAVRHSTATHMLNNGDNLENIREQLGHESLSTTQVYLHVALERRRAQYRKSHPAASSPPATS